MSLPRFQYSTPASLEEALALLARHGSAARVMAGGTDLLPKMARRQMCPAVLISLTRIPELRQLRYQPGLGLFIGATVSLSTILEHAEVRRSYPAIAEALSQLATVQIRNMGTLVGNLCNGSPCADGVPPLIAHAARVAVLAGGSGLRWLPLEGFLVGPGETVLRPEELVREIHVPEPAARAGAAYLCLSARSHVDLSAVSVAALVEREADRCTLARLVLGAVGPTPLRARAAEELLVGSTPTAARLQAAGEAAMLAAQPLTDMRASAEWRRSMVTVLTRRALAAAWQRAGGGDAGGGDAAAGDSGGGDTGEGLCPEVGKDRG